MTLTILLECVEIRWVDVADEETSLLGLLSTEQHCAEWSAPIYRSSGTLDEEEPWQQFVF